MWRSWWDSYVGKTRGVETMLKRGKYGKIWQLQRTLGACFVRVCEASTCSEAKMAAGRAVLSQSARANSAPWSLARNRIALFFRWPDCCDVCGLDLVRGTGPVQTCQVPAGAGSDKKIVYRLPASSLPPKQLASQLPPPAA